MNDDLIKRLEARSRWTNLNVSDGDLFRELAAEIRTLRAERDAALAEGVALGIEAGAKVLDAEVIDLQADCMAGTHWGAIQDAEEIAKAIRNLDPAAIIAARATPEAT